MELALVADAVPRLQIVAGLFLRSRRTLRASFIAGTWGGPASRVPAVAGGAR